MSLIWSPRDPESVYRRKEELPLFDASGLSSNSSGAAQCENSGELALPAEKTSGYAPVGLAGDVAHARRNDPIQSHKAAASVVNQLRIRDAIKQCMAGMGPMSDEQIISRVRACLHPQMVSESGIRTRRSELVVSGDVVQCGTGKTASGRECQIWKAK